MRRVVGQVEGAALGSTEDEQVLGQASESIGFGLDVVELLLERRRPSCVSFVQQVAHPVDRRDGGPKLVADHPDERVPELAVAPFLRSERRGQVVGQPLARRTFFLERASRRQQIASPSGRAPGSGR